MPGIERVRINNHQYTIAQLKALQDMLRGRIGHVKVTKDVNSRYVRGYDVHIHTGLKLTARVSRLLELKLICPPPGVRLDSDFTWELTPKGWTVLQQGLAILRKRRQGGRDERN